MNVHILVRSEFTSSHTIYSKVSKVDIKGDCLLIHNDKGLEWAINIQNCYKIFISEIQK